MWGVAVSQQCLQQGEQQGQCLGVCMYGRRVDVGLKVWVWRAAGAVCGRRVEGAGFTATPPATATTQCYSLLQLRRGFLLQLNNHTAVHGPLVLSLVLPLLLLLLLLLCWWVRMCRVLNAGLVVWRCFFTYSMYGNVISLTHMGCV